MFEANNVRLVLEKRRDVERLPFARLDGEWLVGTEFLGQLDGEPLLPAELQGVCVLSGHELQRSDAHPQELPAVQLLEALRDHGPDAH